MKLSRGLRREKTNVPVKTTTTFNAPGVYVPPYGKTVVKVGGRGASGNYTTGGTVAGYNPGSPGYTQPVPGSGGNVAYYNPPSGGTYAGTNPTGYNWTEALYSYDATPFNFPTPSYLGPTYHEYMVNSQYTTIASRPFPAYGLPHYYPGGTGSAYFTSNTMYRSIQTSYATYAIPAPYSYNGSGTSAVFQYFQLAVYPGGAYYNPTYPGTANYNPYYPAYSYYVPAVPGNAYYNPTYPGTGGGNNVIAGVYFQGGGADELAPLTAPTATELQYSEGGINITVPTGGYVTIENI